MARPRRRGPRGCTNNCAVCPGPVLERPKCALGAHQGHCLCLEHALEASRATPMPDPAPRQLVQCVACWGTGKSQAPTARSHGDGTPCEMCAGTGTKQTSVQSLLDINGNFSVGNMPSREVIMGTNEVDRGVHARISDAMRAAAGLLRVGPRRTPSIDDRIRARDEQLATGRAPQVTTWRTQDGREIPIATMEDTHLHNTIRYLERKVAEARAPALLRLATDRARAEEIRRLATAAFSSYAALVAEAKKRELGPTLGTDMADLETKIAAEQRVASESDAAARMRLVAEEMGQGPKKDGK